MVSGMSCVPHRIPQPLSRSVNRVNQLQLDSGLCNRFERFALPVHLFGLLPHHHVELAVGLVAEDKSNVVIVSACVDKKGAFKVDTSKFVPTNGQTRVDFFSLAPSFQRYLREAPVRLARTLFGHCP